MPYLVALRLYVNLIIMLITPLTDRPQVPNPKRQDWSFPSLSRARPLAPSYEQENFSVHFSSRTNRTHLLGKVASLLGFFRIPWNFLLMLFLKARSHKTSVSAPVGLTGNPFPSSNKPARGGTRSPTAAPPNTASETSRPAVPSRPPEGAAGPGPAEPLSAAGDALPEAGALPPPPPSPAPAPSPGWIEGRRCRPPGTGSALSSHRVPDYRNWGKRCPLHAAPEPQARGEGDGDDGASALGGRVPDNELGRDVGGKGGGGGGGAGNGPNLRPPRARAPRRPPAGHPAASDRRPTVPSRGGAAPRGTPAARGGGGLGGEAGPVRGGFVGEDPAAHRRSREV